MKKLLFPLLIAGIASYSTLKTGFDYDRDADFAHYKTYHFAEDDLAKTVGPLNRDRIIAAISKELEAKGLSQSITPDLIVDVHIKSQEKMDATATTTGMGMGYRGYRYGGGFSTTQINYNEYIEGTMFISLVDRLEKKLIWQGTGTKTFDENASTNKREKNITYSIQQILANYPPKEK